MTDNGRGRRDVSRRHCKRPIDTYSPQEVRQVVEAIGNVILDAWYSLTPEERTIALARRKLNAPRATDM